MNKQPSVDENPTVINIYRESNEEISDDETEISAAGPSRNSRTRKKRRSFPIKQ